jgi:hypothetical protein
LNNKDFYSWSRIEVGDKLTNHLLTPQGLGGYRYRVREMEKWSKRSGGIFLSFLGLGDFLGIWYYLFMIQ